jgi:hypothetical protein
MVDRPPAYRFLMRARWPDVSASEILPDRDPLSRLPFANASPLASSDS